MGDTGRGQGRGEAAVLGGHSGGRGLTGAPGSERRLLAGAGGGGELTREDERGEWGTRGAAGWPVSLRVPRLAGAARRDGTEAEPASLAQPAARPGLGGPAGNQGQATS